MRPTTITRYVDKEDFRPMMRALPRDILDFGERKEFVFGIHLCPMDDFPINTLYRRNDKTIHFKKYGLNREDSTTMEEITIYRLNKNELKNSHYNLFHSILNKFKL
tara:strand:- start:9936 stop:10253 length:318 start_codon:yes stop_codon:yes gene_type:complete